MLYDRLQAKVRVKVSNTVALYKMMGRATDAVID